jgi:hypothetical protein
MKTSYATAIAFAFAALTAGQAMAADVYDNEFDIVISSTDVAPSNVTRAQVLAELVADNKAHQFDVYDSEFGQLVSATTPAETDSDLTRAQVRKEAVQYFAAHKNDAFDTVFNLRLN